MNPRFLTRLKPALRPTLATTGISPPPRAAAIHTTRPLASTPSSAPKAAAAATPRGNEKPPLFPTVEACPEPTCACAPMPQDLEIDHESPLKGVFAPYAEQVLVCTGRDDWASRVEEEKGLEGGGEVVSGLKGLFGRGGKFCDPYHVISPLASSFPSPTPASGPGLYLFPSFTYIPSIPTTGPALAALAKAHLLPQTLHHAHASLEDHDRARLTRDPAAADGHDYLAMRDVKDVVVLICGHGGRDRRCGVMGPLLRGEFARVFGEVGVDVLEAPSSDEGASAGDGTGKEIRTARVGLISHIGGHKFAGNVIVYIPPDATVDTGAGKREHPLAGCGVWYGRVEPSHVEGIVRETVLKGNIVLEHFRGGIDGDRKMMRV